MTNKQIRFDHTKIRMLERCSIDIDIDDYDSMCILTIFGLEVKKSRNRYSKMIYFKSKYIIVGYNKRTGLIDTLLCNRSYKRLIKNEYA
jgi:hypothetical protein